MGLGLRRVIAWDTWAFAEVAMGAPRRHLVEALFDDADEVVTARDIVAETFNLLTGRERSNRLARGWMEAVLQTGIRVVDPSMEAISEHIRANPRADRLSWADFALALVAERAGARRIATEDGGFRQLGFDPIFAD